MKAADLETGLARKISSLETSLARIQWRLHIPRVDYPPFIAAQKIISAQLRAKSHKPVLVLKLIIWIAVFLATLYVTQNYNDDFVLGIIITIFAVISAFCLFLFGNARSIYKALYEARCDLPCDLLFREGGVLMLSDFGTQLFPWDGMEEFLEDRHGRYLVSKYITVLMLPKAILNQYPDASALIAFIGQKTTRSGSA